MNDRTKVLRRAQLRDLLSKGAIEEAGKKAEKWGMDIEECKLIHEMDGPPEVILPPGVVPPQPVEPEEKPWPKKTSVFVYAYPINRRMIIVRLPDKREALFWRSSNQQYPIGAELKAKLLETVAKEAYYELDYD